MRMFGLIGLVLALVVVGVLMKKQLGGVAASAASVPGGELQQGRQLQQDLKKSLDAALQQPRPMPEEAP